MEKVFWSWPCPKCNDNSNLKPLVPRLFFVTRLPGLKFPEVLSVESCVECCALFEPVDGGIIWCCYLLSKTISRDPFLSSSVYAVEGFISPLSILFSLLYLPLLLYPHYPNNPIHPIPISNSRPYALPHPLSVLPHPLSVLPESLP